MTLDNLTPFDVFRCYRLQVAVKDREQFPEFALQNPALKTESNDVDITKHPLLRPSTPLKEKASMEVITFL